MLGSAAWRAATCVGTGLALTREQRKALDDTLKDDDNRGREQSFPSEEPEVEGLVDLPVRTAMARA